MMFILFLMMALTIALLWAGYKKTSIALFSLYLLCMVVWFSHQITDKIHIVL